MTSEQLRAFLQVAREGRVSTAARGLGLSQSGLSRQLQALEAEVGARLLVRTPSGAVLTDAGERFLPHATRALEAMASGRAELERLAGTPRGPVVLGVLPTVGAFLAPDLMAAFVPAHPEVRPRLVQDHAPVLEEGVARGTLDLAILTLPVRRVDLVTQLLWDEPLVLAVPRGHRLTRLGRPVALQELTEETWVRIPNMVGTRAVEAACEARGVTPKVALETDTAEALGRMVERGLGLALVPRLMAKDAPAHGFDVVALARGSPRRQVALVHRGQGSLTAAARVLKDAITDSVKQHVAR
ncbi:transcriptional regulator CynR [Corallococcus caeni]|uniref:LysR family transcriptional regulator n=2 Tax=Corallococcus TaxID=83461 RepID=A0A7Y4K0V4_9BACT|nr:LysR family transcriptional regulator [Corallococcus exercitus]NOK14794.1 LysR family transcriptional regulator [Corallococcus exercitus]GMU01109.1 transcriptional regulator CynR [Corallococcus sp. KH5-1]GMU04014.1 transcriptional regulator CynR [Corallococcus sp. NO1]